MPNTHSTLTGLFTDIADAIREKDGTSTPKVADAFPAAIRAIPTGGGEDHDAEDEIIMRTISAYENSRVIDIGSGAFYYCTSLATVSFPACRTIGSYAFQGCNSLATVSFPACVAIRSSAFQGCTRLTTASFPACTTIGANAFYRCYNLLSLYITTSSVCKLSASGAFNSTPIAEYTESTGGVYGSIFVPASLVAAYKSATNWTYFADRITAVPEEA